MGATTKVFGNPKHPYTQMLLASVPQLHAKWADQTKWRAEPDELVGSNGGSPALVEVEKDHFVTAFDDDRGEDH